MKKVISVFLAMLLAFSAFAVCAAAGDYQTYYMAYDVDDSTISIVPVEGYSQ